MLENVGLIIDVVSFAVLPAIFMIWKQGTKIDELGREHDEIKETLKNVDRNIDEFSSAVENKIERILVEHGAHERDQAVQLELLRDIKETVRGMDK